MSINSLDLTLALGLFAAWFLWLAAYGLRCIVRGRMAFDRVGKQGGTPFLGLWVMNAGYWLLDPLAGLLVSSKIGPAWLSWLSLVPAWGAAFAVALGRPGFAAWGLFVSALLDVLDGAVARRGGTASPAGAILDSTLDRYAEFMFFGGLLVHWREHVWLQLTAFAALAGSVMVTYSTAKAEALGLVPPRGMMKRSDRLSCLVLGLVLTTPLAWFSQGASGEWPLMAAVALVALLANLSAVHRFISLARQSREKSHSP